jgi:hypothetical protein
MRLLEKLKYQWTDNRRKLLLVLAMIFALGLVIVQSLLLGGHATSSVLMASRAIEAGESVGEDNTERVPLETRVFQRFDYADGYEGKVAAGKLKPGDLLQASDLVAATAFFSKKETDYLVSLDLAPEAAASYRFHGGDRVDLIHVTGDQVIPIRIFKAVHVYEMVYENPKSLYPETVILRVEEAIRDYILSHRREGHFELSP